jgi:uncharacterized membrane protein
MEKLTAWLAYGLSVAYHNLHDFMAWNSFLAFIPLVLSLWLFRGRGRRSPLWWAMAGVWLAFLPNAPYILTDIIHLVHDVRRIHSIWIITLIVVPQYFLFMAFGLQAYSISVMNLGHYLQRQGLGRWICPAEVVIHGLCAVGIYLGRFPRFNSWDLVLAPHSVVLGLVHSMTQPRSLGIMVVTFTVLALVYSLTKALNLAIAWAWQRGGVRALLGSWGFQAWG